MKNYTGSFSKKEIYRINKKQLVYEKSIIKDISKIKIGDKEKQVINILRIPSEIRKIYDYGPNFNYKKKILSKKDLKTRVCIGYIYEYKIEKKYRWYSFSFEDDVLTKISKNF